MRYLYDMRGCLLSEQDTEIPFLWKLSGKVAKNGHGKWTDGGPFTLVVPARTVLQRPYFELRGTVVQVLPLEFII